MKEKRGEEAGGRESSGAPKNERLGSRLLDKGSYLSGLASGLIVIGVLVLFIYLSSQPQESGSAGAPATPQAQEPPKRAPAGLQVSVKNDHNQTVLIRGGKGSGFENDTRELAPGEVATVEVATPKGCGADVSQCWQTLVVAYYMPQPQGGGLGNESSGSFGQNGALPGAESGAGNESGSGSQPPPGVEPLEITTSSLPSAIEDAKYSFALEASGGIGSGYGWTASGLPRGLAMAQNGMIYGAPLEKGTFTVGVVVYDGKYSAYRSLQLTVN